MFVWMPKARNPGISRRLFCRVKPSSPIKIWGWSEGTKCPKIGDEGHNGETESEARVKMKESKEGLGVLLPRNIILTSNFNLVKSDQAQKTILKFEHIWKLRLEGVGRRDGRTKFLRSEKFVCFQGSYSRERIKFQGFSRTWNPKFPGPHNNSIVGMFLE